MISVCMPTGGSIKTATVISLIKLFQARNDLEFLTQTSSILHENRNRLVEKAKGSHVLFIDSDIVFEPEMLSQLLQRDKDVIGALYYARKLPKTPTCKKLAEGFEIWEKEGDLITCAGVGTGFLLIKKSVFRKLKRPYFFWEHKENGDFDYGEDMYFCRKAREEGFKIYLDPTITVGHLGDYLYE